MISEILFKGLGGIILQSPITSGLYFLNKKIKSYYFDK